MVQLRPDLQIVEVAEGKVLLDTRRGVYWHLNEAAITVLEHLSRGRTIDDLVGEVVRATGADAARVRADHLTLLDELRQAKLVDGTAA